MLYLISLGLFDEKDMSLKALETAKKCDKLYVEFYTCPVNTNEEKISKLIGKQVKRIERSGMEEDIKNIITDAKNKDVCIFVPGDALSATTHVMILKEAKEMGINYKIIHGSSIFSAIAETGLQLYKFGKTVTLTREFPDSSLKAIKNNKKMGLHTLILLDIDMDAEEGLKVLKKRYPIEIAVVATQLGGDETILYGKVKDLLVDKKLKGKLPAVIIIPGRMHFMEKEFLESL